MGDTTSENIKYERAKKRVEDLKGFYVHLAVYVTVNLGLFLINWLTDSGNWWFYWPLVGWGVALTIHAVMVFWVEGPLGQSWEDRKIHELMEHDQDSGRA